MLLSPEKRDESDPDLVRLPELLEVGGGRVLFVIAFVGDPPSPPLPFRMG